MPVARHVAIGLTDPLVGLTVVRTGLPALSCMGLIAKLNGLVLLVATLNAALKR